MNPAASWYFRSARLAYSLLIHALIPVALLHFLWRSRREPGYRHHLVERLGAGPDPEPGPELWVHAASLGEMRVAGVLLRALCRDHPSLRIQLTTLTPAGRAEGERMRANGLAVTVRYLPLDSPPLLRRFIRRLEPGILVLIETELWPNLLWQIHRTEIPAVLVNARLSPRLRSAYHRLRALYGPLLAGFEWVAAQAPEDAEHFRSLGARKVVVTGNLKFDLPSSRNEIALARGYFAGRWLWVAGSTTLGELAGLYALADAAFVGGSLVDHGGQNPLEPIAADCPVIVGPDSRNFADMVRQLVADRAIVQVADAEGLRSALENLLLTPEHGAAMVHQAQQTVNANRGATARTLELLRPLLPPAGSAAR
ncbi:MAG: hypothetical protein LC667_15555 [Thioalkalivibrio sp.]|nr:hypothetical protein [Thioalkalivibrio sp.]